MTPDLPPPIPRKTWPTLLWGMVMANLVGGVLYYFLFWFITAYKDSQASILGLPNLFLVPFLAGIVAAWCWRKLERSLAVSFLDALGTSLLSLVAAAIFLREGAVCMVMAFPALYTMICGGILLGRWWFGVHRSSLRLTIFPVLILATAADSYYGSHPATVVTDEVLIHAPPAKVWPHVLAFPDIPDPPSYWIFRLGLPYPVRTTNGGNYIGATRECVFSNGVVIHESVAEFEPNERLTFDIVEQPTDPEAYGHITLQRGQFQLQDNHDGTTTLIGSSWYTLHVRPRWYFDLWARDMSRAVHLRVMNHIRRLSEQGS